MVERRLGRGLDFFLSGSKGAAAAEPGVAQIEVNQLTANPHQPRQQFDELELEQLAHSIRASGVLQPILVRKVGDKYQIVAGERRWRAAQKAGLERVPALVRDFSDEMACVVGLVENLQRADLNAIEKAKAFQQIQRLTKTSQEDVARQVGLDRSTVANFLRLLELPEEVQAHVSRGTLSMGHARALLGVAGGDTQKALAEAALRRGLNVRQTEALVKDLAQAAEDGGKSDLSRNKNRPVWVGEIEEVLAEALGAAVNVRYGTKRSKITIECVGREQFERVYERLKSLGAEA